MKWILLTLGVLILVGVSFLAGGLYVRYDNMDAEYHTAGTIRSVSAFIETHGRWPSGWEELGTQPSPGVRIQWALPLAGLDAWKIHQAINVQVGRWYVYPHYEADIEHLAAVVREVRERAQKQVLP